MGRLSRALNIETYRMYMQKSTIIKMYSWNSPKCDKELKYTSVSGDLKFRQLSSNGTDDVMIDIRISLYTQSNNAQFNKTYLPERFHWEHDRHGYRR